MDPGISFVNLFGVALVAFAAPLLLGFVTWLRIPDAVAEIVAGIVLGPAALGWLEPDQAVRVVALLGLAFLLFTSGLELDLAAVRGAVGRLGALAHAASLALAVVVGLALEAIGWVRSPLLVAVALSATGLGLIVPVLKDAGHLESTTGALTVTAATIADFTAIVLLSLLFSREGAGAASAASAFVGFVAAVAVAYVVVRRGQRSPKVTTVVARLADTTAQLRVRGAVVLLVGFAALAEGWGVEMILGAFIAGAIVNSIDRDTASHPHFRIKLDAIGYGLAIPVFFVASGLTFDLDALFSSASTLVRIPVFLLALLVVRALPALVYRRTLAPRALVAAGLLQATSLPLVVSAVAIGRETGAITAATGGALVAAALLSVTIFPAAALSLLRRPARPVPLPSHQPAITQG